MRKILAIVLALALVFAFAGCGAKDDGKIRIAGVVFQDDEFMTQLTNGMRAAADEEGVELFEANTSSDQAKEVELIRNYTTQKLDGICIAPLDPDASIRALGEAAKEGLYITTVNMPLKDVDFLTGGYTSDDVLNANLVGDEAVKYINENMSGRKLNIAVINFADQIPLVSAQRCDGFTQKLDEAGIEYEIVATASAPMEDKSLELTQAIIAAHPDLDIIYGANSGGLVGAVNAIKGSQIAGTCKAFGYDGNDVITTMLKDDANILQAVVAQDPYTQGYKAAKLLIKAIREGKKGGNASTEIVPGLVLVRGDNQGIDDFRKANGYD